MKITLTEQAKKKIEEKLDGGTGYLKLKYDTEGCGCVVSGVTALWFVKEVDEGDREVQTNGRSIYVEKSKEVFLDDIMTIDYSSSANCYQLKSPNQYLNPRMSFLIKTNL
ncbi:iron-sulfur cluster biosynthesis family protein (plasmid) [Bacillus sp. 31A1R]|uniref:Iron-sulfur cluster biosynthesis family protein n=1 Tax=Robertmurraya mangrovi TaxID=3098077 RepID=A0ABU5IVD5_9BACI|nr:iron-sulfur cluster biosynthesis family protein [Bacillus sp. 31A1R]MDZ5471111.1 iron-sulfur cluster biosynthesis family protein [Bacillus sp. 31A1R]